MNSRKSYGHKRQYEDRSTRQWNDSDDEWKESRRHHSDMPRDSFHKYAGDAYTSTERTRGNREYSDSPKRMHSKDSLNRDWSRRSPMRRHSLASVTPDKQIDFGREYANLREESQELLGRERELRVKENRVGRKEASLDGKQFSAESKTLPEWSVSKKKQQRFSKDIEDDFKYRQEPEDLKYRQSPDNFTYRHLPKDFKRRVPSEEDLKYREMPKDSKHRQQHEEFAYGQQPQDFTYRRPSGYYKDKHFQDQKNLLGKRTQSQEFPTRGFGAEHDVTNQGPALAKKIAEQKTATKGFQRFLDVLNKGVDVAMLNKIVNQSSTVTEAQSCSPAAHLNTADPPSCTRQQESHQTTPNWSESKGCQREAAQRQGYRHLNTEAKKSDLHIQKGCSLSDEMSLQKNDVGDSDFSSDSRSRSSPVVEKTKLTPEDVHKHRQMQDVLQAIGMDLGFEELGQMSNRIQERLYGKKDCDRGQSDKERMEKEMKQVFSPGHHSRSSSSGKSSFGSLTQHFSLKKDSCKAQMDTTEVHQTVEYAHTNDKSSNRSLQDGDNSGNQSQESTVSFPFSFSPNPTYTVSEPPTPVMTSYSAGQYSPYTYPVATPAEPPNWGLPVGTKPSVPHLPGYLHYPSAPVLNSCQSATAQSNTYLQHASNRQLTYLNAHDPNPVQPLNTTQNSTTLSRPRFLQVIDTEQTETTTHGKTKYLIENVEELKKYFLSLEKVQKYSQSKQNDAFRVLLFNPRRLKVLAQKHKTYRGYLNDTPEKPNLDSVDCLEVACPAAPESRRIVPRNAEKKQTIKLRLCEQTLSDKPPGGTGGSGLHSEPGKKVPKKEPHGY